MILNELNKQSTLVFLWICLRCMTCSKLVKSTIVTCPKLAKLQQKTVLTCPKLEKWLKSCA